MRGLQACVGRVEQLLEALTRASLGKIDGFEHLDFDQERSKEGITIYRFRV